MAKNAANAPKPLRVIRSEAPVRVCDNGGWTDTWFARHGKVFNVAVSPVAEVEIAVRERRAFAPRVLLDVVNYGDRYALGAAEAPEGRHPLLEAALQRAGVPADLSLEVRLFSEAPPGASLGTSAAVAVALVGALEALHGRAVLPAEAARAAHSIEVDRLKRQSGIQDQLASAHGGFIFIDMHAYPQATVERLPVAREVAEDLEQRLVLVYLGRSHDSSAVHEKVIRQLADAGPEDPRLQALRQAAQDSRSALLAGDLRALGRAMIANTEAQARLHPELVGRDARCVIEIARAHEAAGYKVNGAGGEGGSLTVLASPRAHVRRAMIRAIAGADPLFRHLPVRLHAGGLTVTDVPV
jgi:D-glycero-alpha-D-manno-heptose-7-phosphate kinase